MFNKRRHGTKCDCAECQEANRKVDALVLAIVITAMVIVAAFAFAFTARAQNPLPSPSPSPSPSPQASPSPSPLIIILPPLEIVGVHGGMHANSVAGRGGSMGSNQSGGNLGENPAPATDWKSRDANPGPDKTGFNFTALMPLAEAKAHKHMKQAVLSCSFAGTTAIDPATPYESFLGNVLLVVPGLSGFADDGPEISRFWIDTADVNQWVLMLALLRNSRTIQVVYDPECGLVESVKVTGY